MERIQYLILIKMEILITIKNLILPNLIIYYTF